MAEDSQLAQFQKEFVSLQHAWDLFNSQVHPDDNQPNTPLFFDLLSGPNYPLTQAFAWAGWRTMQPLDLKIDPDFNLNHSSVRKAIAAKLPECHLCSAAMDCSTKSRVREIAMPGGGPQPLRSNKYPRGLPSLKPADKARVDADNQCSDFLLAMQAIMQANGRGALRENPRRSLHWSDPVEAFLFSQGVWQDYEYDACCYLATRRKAQTIRHNVDEMRKLPNLICAHTHDAAEWRPIRSSNGSVYYPSREESEYTASLVFTIAVSCSFWATQRGFAKLHISRLPSVECSGDRSSWLQLPADTFRARAMVSTAIQVGLLPLQARQQGCPQRVHVQDVLLADHTLPSDVIYVGYGHFRHRLPVSKWVNPFKVGVDGSHATVFMRFLANWTRYHELNALQELQGKRLACDCLPQEPCHADILVALYYEQFCTLRQKRRVRTSLPQVGFVRMVSMTPAVVSQATAQLAIRSQFPTADFSQVHWPIMEDIINDDAFLGFQRWVHQQGLPADGPLGPLILPRTGVHVARASLAEQSGAAARKSSLPPLVPFGLEPEDHFSHCQYVHEIGTPLEGPVELDLDLHFAAHEMVAWYHQLVSMRAEYLAKFRILCDRLSPVSETLRLQQDPVVRSANPKVHLAMLALLVCLLQWPDTSFCHHLFTGFPAVGYLPPCGIWDSQVVDYISLQEVFADGPADGSSLIQRLRPSDDDHVILEAGNKDEAHGWCSPAFPLAHLKTFPEYRLIKRFVITQASGKKRVIDDAASGGQSFYSHDANKLQFTTALQPCQHVKLLVDSLLKASIDPHHHPDSISTVGEDLPDAYRKIPMWPPHSRACLVTYWDSEAQAVRIRQYHSMLFGLPLAVTAFNRLPFLLQAIVRRVCRQLCSFYYDDATQQDWTSTSEASQFNLECIAELVGYPFATEKRQLPQATGDFLGLVHDLSQALQQDVIHLWIRDRLHTKIHEFLDTAMVTHQFHPGSASKLFGCVTFLDQAVFSRVARSGLNAIKDRQYHETDTHLTPGLVKSFQIIRAILMMQPKRSIHTRLYIQPRMFGAADAAQEPTIGGSGGFLLVTPMKQRLGAVVSINQHVMQLWPDHDIVIAQLELLMILQAILTFPDSFRGCTGFWFCDNIAALMSLVRGRSDNDSLDFMASMVHMLLFHLNCYLWFEWVPSKSNWSDGISRDGFHDSFWREHLFTVHLSTVPTFLWQFDITILTLIFAYL